MSTLTRIVFRPFARLLKPLELREFDGSAVPTSHFRRAATTSPREFVAAGEECARRLVETLGLGPSHAVLDIGCGAGRLAIGILRSTGEISRYRGVDVRRREVEWARRHVQRAHPAFEFHHFDVRNDRYNPRGRLAQRDVRLPFVDASFDVVAVCSLFSHLVLDDVTAYLGEIQRLTRPGGKLYLKAHLGQDCPDFEVDPTGVGPPGDGPLRCVRFESAFFERLLTLFGFHIDEVKDGADAQGRSAVHAVRNRLR